MNRWLVHHEALSPNHNERKLPISMVVLHYTGMRTGAEALERMCDASAEVSAHYMIDEDGTVTRLVPEDRRAPDSEQLAQIVADQLLQHAPPHSVPGHGRLCSSGRGRCAAQRWVG